MKTSLPAQAEGTRQPAAVRPATASGRARATQSQWPDGSPRQLAQRGMLEATLGAQALQRAEDEEPLQGQAMPEEEEPLQGKATEEEEPLQGMAEDEELLQGMAEDEEPLQGAAEDEELLQGKPAGAGGLPAELRAGVAALSGQDLSNVRVHDNSALPAQVGALAYAQGDDIHLGPGQQQHLPHEAWHVAQQRQGRVRPTTQAKGVAINDDAGLEREADAMGAKALQAGRDELAQRMALTGGGGAVLQRRDWYAYGGANVTPHVHCYDSGAHLKIAGGARYNLVVDGYRVEQARINDAFDAIREQYPLANNPVRMAVLAAMQDILRDAPIRRA